MKSLVKNDRALLFQLLIGAAMAIIIFFAVMNIGTFINGTIAQSMTDTYPTNVASGSADTTVWNNRTAGTDSYSTSVTLPIDVSIFDNDDSVFYILANTTALDFDLNVNGQLVNKTFNVTAGAGHNVTFEYLLSNSSVNATDTVLNFQWNYTTLEGGVGKAKVRYYVASYTQPSDLRTDTENRSVNTMINLSGDYDNVLDSLAIAAVVMAITLPLAAVVAIRKFF